MMCDTGRLMAYRDGALAGAERETLEAHLAACTACRRELAALQRRGDEVGARLQSLEPHPALVPGPGQAWARFRESLAEEHRQSVVDILKRGLDMAKQSIHAGRWRPAAVGVAALLVVAVLFSFAPVREAAADFLGIFRVRKFAAIPVDPAQVERLEEMGGVVESTLGEPTFVRQPGKPQPVEDAQEASSLAGFPVRVPAVLPKGATLQRFTVTEGPALRFEIRRDTAQTLVEALGLEGVTLPDADPLVVEGDIPVVVEQTYQVGLGRIEIVQIPNPTATLPEGVEPAVLGELMLRLLGLPAEDAARMARSIDWTCTVVIPLPTDVVEFREVEVDGVIGLWLEERVQAGASGPSAVILWEREGVVYGAKANGHRATDGALLRAASSLH